MVFSRKSDSKAGNGAAHDPRLDAMRGFAQPQAPAASAAPVAHAAGGPSHEAEHESIIGNDLSIEGQSITIRCKGSLRVNGNIQADLHSRNLVVGEEAIINGSIAADQVDVLGRVNGAIYGAQVTLHASAHVEGDIHSRSLSIENGASFDGRSRKVANAAEIAPQLEAGAARGTGLGPSGGGDAAARSGSTIYTPPTSRLHA